MWINKSVRATAIVLALAAIGCTADDDQPVVVPATTPAPVPAPGGRMVIGVIGEPATLDPYDQAASDLTRALARPIYPSLFRFSPDGRPELYLASSLSVARGSVRVDLRAARWSDGRPITARDVVASVRRARPPSGFARVESVRAAKRRTVVFRGRVDNWPAALATAAFVLPRGRVSRAAGGPFGLARRVPGLRFVYEPNPQWWGDPVFLDRLVVVFTEDPGTLLSLLEEGRVDVAVVPSSVNLGARLDALEVEHQSVLGWESVVLDLSNSGLDRPGRVALWRALRRGVVDRRLVRGDGRVSNTLRPGPGSDGADGPFRRVRGPAHKPGGVLRLVVPNGDGLLALLHRALFEQLQPRGFEIELVGLEGRVFYGSEVDGAALVRRAGALGMPEPAGAVRGLHELPLFHVRTFLAWRPGIHGVAPNPSIEGPLWNVEEWWRESDAISK